jgi:hypothetical protein
MQTRVADTTADVAAVDTARPEGGPALPPRVSWGAVFAGAIVAIAVGAALNVLGVAVGATTVDPQTPGGTPSASTFGIYGGVWLLVANLIGLATGGYVAARLSGTADDTDGVLHGLAVWALGFVVTAAVLGNVVAGTASATLGGVSSAVSGLARGAGGAVQAAAGAASDTRIDPQALVERARAALQTGGDPARMTTEQRAAETGQILTRRMTQGEFSEADRNRLAALVAAETNIPQEEARQRVQQVEDQARQATQEVERRALQVAEAAATGTAVAAYWFFAAMLLGAVASVLGARVGTRTAMRVAARRYA